MDVHPASHANERTCIHAHTSTPAHVQGCCARVRDRALRGACARRAGRVGYPRVAPGTAGAEYRHRRAPSLNRKRTNVYICTHKHTYTRSHETLQTALATRRA
eukprot:scaffold1424_cov359-Prasinococcus_capsulatus_cf.AAC.5